MGKLEGVGEDGKTELWEKGGNCDVRDFEIGKGAACAVDRDFEISKTAASAEDRDFEISKMAASAEDRNFEISKRAGDCDDRNFEISKRALIFHDLLFYPLLRLLIFLDRELVHGHSLHVLLDDGFHLPFEEVEGVGRDCGEDILMQ